MKEYRVRAYFTKMYTPRSYKGKLFVTLPDALDALEKAKVYYSDYKYLDRIVIESREVSDWVE